MYIAYMLTKDKFRFCISFIPRILILAVPQFISCHIILAQEDQNFPPPDRAPIVIAQKVQESVKIDGKLDEDDWQNAKAVTDFFRMEPRQGGSYLYDTRAKLLYDQRNLYVGVFCKDSLGKKGVRVQDLRRDFNWGVVVRNMKIRIYN